MTSVASAAILSLLLGSEACSQDITTGLVGNWKLNETSGTTAVDSSSNANNGTYQNGVALASSTPCPVDGTVSATFDGTNDYVSVGNENQYHNMTGPMTVAIWIKVTAFTYQFQDFFSKGDGSGWRLLRENLTNGVTFACSGLSTFQVKSVSTVNDGKWHHLAGVYTGSQLQIYVDGVLDNSVASSGSINKSNYPIEIAQNAEATGRYFYGSLYDARLYSRALSATDVAYLYTLGGPIGEWRLNETSGTSATDSSVHQNNGTYTNSPTLAQGGPYPGLGDKGTTFDGSNDLVSIPNEQFYDVTSNLTVSAWIKTSAFTLSNQTIVAKGNSSWRLARDAATNNVAFTCTGLSTNTKVATTSNIVDGQWHLITGTYDGSNLKMYVDGALQATATASGSISTNSYVVDIGENAESTGRQWSGSIHDARIYSRALSASEVGVLYGQTGHWKLADGSGTTAVDSSPFVKNLTLTGSTNWSTRCNGAGVFNFNGTTQYLSATNASQFQPTGGIAVAAWIKGNSWGSGTNVNTIVRKGETEPNNYQLCIQDGKVTLHLDASDGGGVQGNTVLATGAWYHVAATWDGSLVKIFVNGQLDNTPVSRTATLGTDTRALYVGGRSGADLFNGMIYDVYLYNRAIYPSEIAALYGLIGYWKLDETSGTSASDSSNAGNTGTVSGLATWVAGDIGNCLQLDGATKITVTGLMNKPKNVTLAAWAKLTSADTGGAEVISLGNYVYIRLDSGTTSLASFYNGASFVNVSINQTFAGGGWHHFAAVFDDDQNAFHLYLDGVDVANTSTAVTLGYSGQGTNAIIGSNGNGGSTTDFTGLIDDVRIYNRALCPDEVLALKTQGSMHGVHITKWIEIQ